VGIYRLSWFWDNWNKIWLF